MILCSDGHTVTPASVVALGMFDGVHIGHQTLLKEARCLAREEGVPLVVQTFVEHPLCLLAPDRCPPLLTTPEEREKLMRKLGVDVYCVQHFTPEVMDQAPESFVKELAKRWNPVVVVVGFNYTFGRGGAGTPETLKTLGEIYHFKTIVMPAVRWLGGKPVSATGIRADLASGRVMLARLLLNRPYTRGVELTRRAGARCEFRMTADGKQTPAPGGYYALLSNGERSLPVLIRIREDATALCLLPEALELQDRYVLHLLEEKSAPVRACRKRR